MLLHQEHFTWICPKCAIPNFTDSFFDETDLADNNLFDSLSELDSSMNSTGNVMDSPLHSSSPIKSQDQRNETTARSETDKRNGQRTSKPLQNKTKTKLKKKKLKFMTINCDGLKGKQRQNYLATIIDEEQPDIIMGQESKLDGTYTDAEVFPDGYLVKRKDRNKSGGGVFIAYRDSLVVSEVKGVGKDCELVVLKVEVWKSSPIYIASFWLCFKMIVSMSDGIWYKLWLPFLFCNDCFHIITHEHVRNTKLSLYNVRIWNLHTTFDCSRKNWPCRTESIEIGFPEFQHSNRYSIESFYH